MKTPKIRVLAPLLGACVLFVASAAFAAHAQAGVIQGQLRDTHGAPVASAILQFDPMSGVSGTPTLLLLGAAPASRRATAAEPRACQAIDQSPQQTSGAHCAWAAA